MDMILILYVNDLLLLGEDLSKIEDIKRQLSKLYQMKDLRPASSYLGIQITRDWNTCAIWIDQQVYIENALKIDWLWSGLVQVRALFSWTWTLTIRFGPADWWIWTPNLLNRVQ